MRGEGGREPRRSPGAGPRDRLGQSAGYRTATYESRDGRSARELRESATLSAIAMSAKLVFWTASFINLSAVVLLVLRGRVEARRGRIAAHRRSMHLAAALVGLFVVAYVAKVLFLGKEDLAVWSRGLRTILYVHESFIAVMLLTGIAARLLAARALLARTAPVASTVPASPLAWHRWLGRTALLAALAALVTGGMLLVGMWRVEAGLRLAATALP